MQDAYIDIETTGLSSMSCSITVVGIYRVDQAESQLVQLVGNNITRASIEQAVCGVDTIYTYNGQRFDLPFIYDALGLDLNQHCRSHRDLMFDCWRHNLYGGLKKVEVKLGISRQIEGIGGWEAVLLWRRYQQYGDTQALDTLLKYNAEDVMNLKILKEKLDSINRV
ncbi:MAG: ribonuclease H-like domain-containing protein [Dehalococcoidales bacterium]|nr:ribonuclease H-like domain-containing protein [Dehalococcoidales bacterium]NLE90113.1 ribonuclease H-like domain-containing protein [Dehalococcoidales bacterium]